MTALRDLPGLGPKSEQWLKQAGIADEAQLRALGAVAAFLRLEQAGLRPSLNFLYALAGAIEGRPWTEIARQEKGRLLLELESLREYRARLADPPPP
ncbi:TfoX/Sxy family protein [Gallaecimonas sp. GXIMD4217]|uniref:TfoX/Sxy family protein n=1 Tax=Gallaecimonas sp. GXIMD4217 TaxID=3131927 RepID=UPI00311ABBAC